MAKKTPAGATKRKIAVKETPNSNKGWAGGDKYNSNFMDNKNPSGKFKGARIEKKRG